MTEPSAVRTLLVSALLGATLAPGRALAFDLLGTGPLAGASVQIIDDFELRYHHVPNKLVGFEDRNIHDYFEQVNRVNALLATDHLSVGAQLDQVGLFANRYVLDDVMYHSWDLMDPSVVSPWDDAYVRLEKLYVQQRWQTVELTVGDTYASFGRGVVLNIVKNTDVDIDTSLQGVKAVVRSGATDVTIVSGLTNRQQISQDQINLAIDEDDPSMVTGARVERYGIGPANVGLHGVLYRFSRGELPGTPLVLYTEALDATAAGATIEASGVLGIDWFVEGDVFGYRAAELGGEEDDPLLGYAVYGSASAYPGRSVILVEAKRSVDTERINTFVSGDSWEVGAIPTLEYERVITEDSSATVNSNDLMAARVRVDYAVTPPELAFYASLAAFRDLDLEGLHFNASPETIAHGIVGGQWLHNSTVLQFSGGLRRDLRDEAAEGYDQLIHFDGELQVPVGLDDGVELAIGARTFQWGENPQGQADFLEMENALGWHRGDHWAFLVYQDWSNNPLVSSEGNLGEDLYGALEVQWKPGPSTVFKAFYGAYKAGIRCSGGQCRSLPGFEGARLSYTGVL